MTAVSLGRTTVRMPAAVQGEVTITSEAERRTGTMSVVGETRYRCQGCGNLTRFDVTTSRRTRAYHHYSVGGTLEVEDTEVLSEVVESVVCRWCGPAATVEALDAEDARELNVGEAS